MLQSQMLSDSGNKRVSLRVSDPGYNKVRFLSSGLACLKNKDGQPLSKHHAGFRLFSAD